MDVSICDHSERMDQTFKTVINTNMRAGLGVRDAEVI